MATGVDRIDKHVDRADAGQHVRDAFPPDREQYRVSPRGRLPR
jgi:hypothetical protein